jgi:prepilin-type N-terminal cleavage/methylation domain-containing protein
MKKGFTILELLFVILILTVGIGGAFYLISQTFWGVSVTKNRLVAAYLAQEGIEEIRNERDNNWLSGKDWTTGIIGSHSKEIPLNNKTFKRIITAATTTNDILIATTTVSWLEKGLPQSLTVVEQLTNWKPTQ